MNPTSPETTAVDETAVSPAAPTLPPPDELRRRGLFAYDDGFAPRLADVVEVQMRLQDALGGDVTRLEDLLAVVIGPAPAAAGEAPPPVPPMSVPAALVELARAVGIGFDLPPLDPATARGLSVQERVDLLNDFLGEAADGAEGDDEPSAAEDETEVEVPDPVAGPGA